MVALHSIHLCWICGKDVPLEKAKSDEFGNTVHDECVLLRERLVSLQSDKTIPVR